LNSKMRVGGPITGARVNFRDLPRLPDEYRATSSVEFDRSCDHRGDAPLTPGLQTGDRVGVALPKSIDCLIAYYSAPKFGTARAGLYTHKTPSSIFV
jgi:acyl-CoA synthetase (AMP-forming)/AMP-acid ligase II